MTQQMNVQDPNFLRAVNERLGALPSAISSSPGAGGTVAPTTDGKHFVRGC